MSASDFVLGLVAGILIVWLTPVMNEIVPVFGKWLSKKLKKRLKS